MNGKTFVVQISDNSQTWDDECKFWDKLDAVKYAKTIKRMLPLKTVRVLDETNGVQEWLSDSN